MAADNRLAQENTTFQLSRPNRKSTWWLWHVSALLAVLGYGALVASQAYGEKTAAKPSAAPILVSSPSKGGNTAGAADPSALYRRHCSYCHGVEGTSTRKRTFAVPDFTDAKWQQARTDAQLAVAIREGKGDGMPPFDDRLSTEQVRDLVAHVRAFNKTSHTAQPVAGVDFASRLRLLQEEWQRLDEQIRQLRAPQ